MSLLQWITLANDVYLAAIDADNKQATELAYVEYFKAAGSVSPVVTTPHDPSNSELFKLD